MASGKKVDSERRMIINKMDSREGLIANPRIASLDLCDIEFIPS